MPARMVPLVVGAVAAVVAMGVLTLAGARAPSLPHPPAAGPRTALTTARGLWGTAMPPRCPGGGRLVPSGPGDAPAARLAASRFVQAWYAHDRAAAMALADPGYTQVTRLLARGPRRPPAPFVATSTSRFGHSPYARGLALHCGVATLAASWLVTVRSANSSLGARVLIVRRTQGFRVFTVR